MKPSPLFILAILSLLISCTNKSKIEAIEKWKQEIITTEQNFAKMAESEDISNAFLTYAAEDAVLLRNDSLIIGKNALQIHFKNQPTKNSSAHLTWKPDFVEVSESGDLGYTYGNYTYSYLDSIGNTVKIKGVFHTVWKRQKDGSWKFVWD